MGAMGRWPSGTDERACERMGERAPARAGRAIGCRRPSRVRALGLVAGLLAAVVTQGTRAEAEEGAPPIGPGVEAAPAAGASRIVLTPEQREKLRLAREAEARKLLGLAPDSPLPTRAELTDAQRETIRAAREAEMRRVLGLGPDEPIPDRASATDEQRRRIVAAHEARLREALGLAPEAPLSTEPPVPTLPTEQNASPMKPGQSPAKQGAAR